MQILDKPLAISSPKSHASMSCASRRLSAPARTGARKGEHACDEQTSLSSRLSMPARTGMREREREREKERKCVCIEHASARGRASMRRANIFEESQRHEGQALDKTRLIHTMSHHHTYYVTSSYILCHIIIHTMSHHHSTRQDKALCCINQQKQKTNKDKQKDKTRVKNNTPASVASAEKGAATVWKRMVSMSSAPFPTPAAARGARADAS